MLRTKEVVADAISTSMSGQQVLGGGAADVLEHFKPGFKYYSVPMPPRTAIQS